MHITEGIITGTSAVIYTGAGLALVGWGTSRMKKFVTELPEKKTLLGMGGALIFFLSLIPIPAFTGTCTHPTGTPLVAILLGPLIGVALTGASLLLQAAFFAHGGFGTWGANVVALGLCGCVCGWGVFRLARRLGLPLWAAGFAGGLIGDIAVYAASGFILAATLAKAPSPQYSFIGYLTAIYAAYLPTQLPIAVGEMLVTGLALQYAYNQRPEVLEDLGIVDSPHSVGKNYLVSIILLFALTVSFFGAVPLGLAAAGSNSNGIVDLTTAKEADEESANFAGMDEAINEKLAEAAGRPARDPLINTEEMGDLWNLLLLSAGGICGFILGRYWHVLWGGKKRPGTNN
jgi:cobalt/nickel transport system permease protein